MITIGLAGWGDHDLIYGPGIRQSDKLRTYNRYFKTVEVDSSYYAIHKPEMFEKWAAETTADFTFLVKAFQGMTGQSQVKYSDSDMAELFRNFRASMEPLIDAGKLKAVLFQYPPWFDCTRDHVQIVRAARRRMGDVPLALEFRHQSWFEPDMRERTLQFMRDEGWAHSVCDEPQVLPGSVPIVPEATHPALTVVRFHGRNAPGWTNNGQDDWRAVRYLYKYSQEELLAWKERLEKLQRESRELCVIFNNNSGGDAAANARQLMEMLGQERRELPPEPPEQMALFE
ncbi:DUF72 domain-containing protein [Paenibacillus ferrarius]|uniref:DUF72 domain-containing protein n=1 Tax=Paenibacillus ferrarius TaxID=1469647 RepID=UPI003D26753B